MKLITVTILGILVGLALAACGSTDPPPAVEETVAAAVAATLVASADSDATGIHLHYPTRHKVAP